MSKKVTIYDVAQKAGVAISTVSRVLNDSPYVSEDTKRKVKTAIEELEFYPQANARKLASKQPNMVAMAVPTFTSPFFNEVLKGVKDEIFHTDLDLVIYNTGSLDSTGNLKKFLDRGTPDALFIFSIDIDEEIHHRLIAQEVPVILVDTKHPDFDYFWWDNYLGGKIAAEHLVKQGFTRIGMVQALDRSEKYLQREKGFQETLRQLKHPLRDEYMTAGITRKHSGFSEEAGYEAVHILHNRGAMPEAIFCSNDAQALGAYHGLEELNLHVPDDVALIGYDNIKIARYLNLTTIDQKMIDMGAKAIRQLETRLFEKPEDLYQVTVKPELIVRKSTLRSK